MKAVLRRVRISPKKANLIAELVRTKKVIDAIDILKYTPKKGAEILKKVIESATANAEENFKQDRNSLYVKEIIVTEGPTYKRSIPVSRGRVHPLLKRTSHVTVKVESLKGSTSKKQEKAPEVKEEKAEEKEVKVEVKKAKK